MAKTLPKETVAAIERAILSAQSAHEPANLTGLASKYNCSYQSVCYIRRRIENLQKTGLDTRKPSGRKRLPNEAAIAATIRTLLAQQPGLDQSAISERVFEEVGNRLSQATISRLVKKNGIPHKVTNKLYKKTKLVCTDPHSKVVERGMSNERGFHLDTRTVERMGNETHKSYRSPYPPLALPHTGLVPLGTNESHSEIPLEAPTDGD